MIVVMIGPKGGVGKTTVSANLAIALSQFSKSVVAIDLDFGASNLHTIFGLRDYKFSLDDFLLDKVEKFSDIILNTKFENLGIICGGDIPGIANLKYKDKIKLIRQIAKIKSDFVLLDMGAGSANNVIDFLIFAQKRILVTSPEIPSLLNVYSFVKTYVFRRFTLHFKKLKNSKLVDLMEKAKDVEKNPHLKTMESLLKEVENIDSQAFASAKKLISTFNPIILINRIRSANDLNAGKVIKNLMKQYLNIHSSTILQVRDDNAVGIAIAKMNPALTEFPDSSFSQDINEVARQIAVI